jgi:lysophospholipase L1-like esterase
MQATFLSALPDARHGALRALRSLGVAAAAAALLAAAACGGPREAALPAGTPVLVIGDSITAGYGVGEEAAWPAQLARLTGWRVTAAGVSGDGTAGGRERLPPLLEASQPALVVIELGGNDLLRGVALPEIKGNLEAMIGDARAHGAKVVLIAAPQPSAMGLLTSLTPAALFGEVAKREKVPLVEKALPSVLSERELKLDALHPTAAGHRILAARVKDELVAIGLVAKR